MKERTLIIAKHDGVQRGLVGEIIKRFEQRGLKLAGIKLTHATKENASKHYTFPPSAVEKLGENTKKAMKEKGIEIKESNQEIADRIKKWNIIYLTEGPVVVMVFEGYHAVEIGRKIVGHTEARQAQVGTIRGDFAVDSYMLGDEKKRPVRNLVHASGNVDEANTEIKIWFYDTELYDYELHKWQVMH